MNSFYLYISVFCALLFSSCEKKLIAENNHEAPKDTLAKISPYVINRTMDYNSKVQIQKSLESYFTNVWERNNLNGMFLVAKNGEVIYENSRGVSNRNTKSILSMHTPLHIASISKVLTATAIMRLIEAKKINLEQDVNSILCDFPYQDITIRMLLNHRSGLPKYEQFTDNPKVWNKTKLLSNQIVLDLLKKHKFGLYFKPNTRFAYCNTNYALLALIIEKKTGLNYREAMKQMIFDPLKMKNTYVFDFAIHKDTSSQSYVNHRLYQFNYLDDVYGDKNIYSTARDLLQFDKATYSPHFLTPELREQIYKGYSSEIASKSNYGLGIRMTELFTGKKIHFHNGWWHGNTSSYVTIKQDTISIIALSNHYTKIVYNVKGLNTLFEDYATNTVIK